MRSPQIMALLLGATASSCRTAEPGQASRWQIEVSPLVNDAGKAVVNWVDEEDRIVSAALASLACGKSADVTSVATTCANPETWGARIDLGAQTGQLWGPELSAIDLSCTTLPNGVATCVQRVATASPAP